MSGRRAEKRGAIEAGAGQALGPWALRSLRHRDFKLFFTSQAISATGTWLQKIALSWLVYRLTGSAAMLGLVNLAGGVAALPFALIGGAIADRWPRRAILSTVYLWMFLQAVALAALVGTGAIEVWHIFVLEMLLGMGRAVEIPSRQALLLETAGREDLGSAVGLDKGVGNLSRLVGPSLAGVIVATLGEAAAFILNASSFLVAWLCLQFMASKPSSGARPRARSFAGGLEQSVRFVYRDRALRALFGLVGLSAFLALPYVILLPVFAKDVLGDGAAPVSAAVCGALDSVVGCDSPEAIPFGLLMGAVGFGALVGSAFVAASRGRRRGLTLATATVVLPVGILVFASSRSFVLSLAALAVTGFAAIVQTALAHVLLQLRVPDELRGRILGLYAVVFQGMIQLGGVVIGFAAEWFEAPRALAATAAAGLVLGLLLVGRTREVRRL